MSSPVPRPTISPAGLKHLEAFIQDTAKRPEVPPAMYAVANAGEVIYEGGRGERVLGDPNKGTVDLDTMLQLFSMTKFVTTCAALVLVDEGKVTLDDPALISRLLPELDDFVLFNGERVPAVRGEEPDPEVAARLDEEDVRKPKEKITLRMLLTHMSGLAYPGDNILINKWNAKYPIPSMLTSDASLKSWTHPLIFEPGTGYAYGEGLDWAGMLISRVSGLTLDGFFKKYLFSRIVGGGKSLSFYPPKNYKDVAMQPTVTVDAKGTLKLTQWELMDRELDPAKISDYHAGGAGLFGTTRDYLLFLQAVLACAPSHVGGPLPGDRILSPESYLELFHDSATDVGTIKADIVNIATKESWFQPPPKSGDEVGWSVGGILNLRELKTGRPAGCVAWAGAARTQFWVDPVTGIVGAISTQYFGSPADTYWFPHFNTFETAVYAALKSE